MCTGANLYKLVANRFVEFDLRVNRGYGVDVKLPWSITPFYSWQIFFERSRCNSSMVLICLCALQGLKTSRYMSNKVALSTVSSKVKQPGIEFRMIQRCSRQPDNDVVRPNTYNQTFGGKFSRHRRSYRSLSSNHTCFKWVSCLEAYSITSIHTRNSPATLFGFAVIGPM